MITLAGTLAVVFLLGLGLVLWAEAGWRRMPAYVRMKRDYGYREFIGLMLMYLATIVALLVFAVWATVGWPR